MQNNSLMGPMLMVGGLFELFVLLPLVFVKTRGQQRNIIVLALFMGAITMFGFGFAAWRGLLGPGH